MSIVRVNTALRVAAATALRDAIDAGSGAGTVKFYTGTQPADPSVAITSQVLLGTLTFSDPCGTVDGDGLLTFSGITSDSSADATGTATWARFNTSAPAAVLDCDVSATGGGGALQINTTSIVAGGPISITSMSYRLP
jgi:hypothetical protein